MNSTCDSKPSLAVAASKCTSIQYVLASLLSWPHCCSACVLASGWVPPTIPAAPQQQQAVPTVAADVQSTAPELGINRQQQQQLQVQVLPALNQVQKKHQQQQQQDVDKFLSAYGGSSSEGSGDNEHEIATGHDSSSKQQPGPDGHPPGSDQHTVPAAVGRSGSSSDDDSSDDASSDEAGAGGHIVSFF